MTILEKMTALVRELHYWHYSAMDDKHPECTTFDSKLLWESEGFRCCQCVCVLEHASSLQFRCPKCWGDRFATTPGLGGRFSYYCRGHEERGRCGFTWDPGDSWRYFYEITRTGFSSPEEYAKRGS